ncbi:MAG: iron-siderophore ABC transporter substrate-binding protein [Nostocales cyanobacterium 94392]|nr:iron-siderophore ABC transporter substrate-binding protein [Nostocales cyanobacterium 94392]
MYKRIHAIVSLFVSGVLIVFMVSACNSNTFTPNQLDRSSTQNCRVIKHAMGETCIPDNPQRIVVLDVMTMENVIALGQKPLGAPLNNFAPHIPTKGIVDLGDSEAINLERMLALKPDLIIGLADAWAGTQPYPELSQIAPTVLVEFNHSGEWKEIFGFVGEVLAKSEQVKQVMADYSQRVENFQQKMNSGAKSKTQVSVIRLYPETITLYTKPGFIGTILEDAGLSRPPSQDLDLEATKILTGDTIQYTISREAFDKADADAVFVIVGNWDSKIKDVLSSLKSDKLWSTLKAVRQNQVYEVGNYWVGSGPIAANAVIDDLFKYLVETP